MSSRSFRLLGLVSPLPLSIALAGCESSTSRPAEDATTVSVDDEHGVGTEASAITSDAWPAVTQAAPPRASRTSRAVPSMRVEPAPPVPIIAIDTWRDRWPDAARDLDEWTRTYPRAAEAFFAWDAYHDDRAEALVEWAVGNPHDTFEVFLLSRHDWDVSERAMHEGVARPAVRALLDIIRRSPRAWLELAHHPRGLAWLGTHAPPADRGVNGVAQPQPIGQDRRPR